ncbi:MULTISPECIES: hypothetical protein [unclassified Streptomyces]|uniref:hypothetical protein n=1 Tax=unclassified Streptomyces TaxID=2593676 RepID=UPI001587DFDB|nr:MULTISPECIES: hypothetical protein [unclassified Streptomyces]NUV69111.1 hypothetical protein [Streptomyces sp. CAI-121]NUW03404.1 hypothetical protein [Streptomyces sp. CAI 127]NUW15026.1 hypothetical protein [Streptomyces sp. CAI-68]
MKRRRIALLATAAVAAPVFLGGASAVADTVSARPQPHHVTRATTNDDGRNAEGGGLVTRLRGVPAEFAAGGGWEEFDFVLKNTTEEDMSDLWGGLAVNTEYPGLEIHVRHLSVQVMMDGSWVDVVLNDVGQQGDVDSDFPFDDLVLPPGETVFPVRMKFTSDAPLGKFFLCAQTDSEHADPGEAPWETSRIVHREDPEPDPEPSADPDPEPSTDPDPEPSTGPSSSPGPGPSEEPAPGPEGDGGAATGGGSGGDGTGPSSGSPGGTGGSPGGAAGSPGGTGASTGGAGQGGLVAPATGGASAPGGALARTGSDAMANWVLGAGGTLVLLGAALAVVARRARRRNSGM